MANIIIGGTYSLPMVTLTLNLNETVQACKANPRRVAVGFYSTSTDLKIFPTSAGVVLSQIKPGLSTNSGIWFLSEDAGPLVQIEWYALSSSTAYLTVMQVVQEG